MKNLQEKTTIKILVDTVYYWLLFSDEKRIEAIATSMVPQTLIITITPSRINQYSNIGPNKVIINYQKEDKISLRNLC